MRSLRTWPPGGAIYHTARYAPSPTHPGTRVFPHSRQAVRAECPGYPTDSSTAAARTPLRLPRTAPAATDTTRTHSNTAGTADCRSSPRATRPQNSRPTTTGLSAHRADSDRSRCEHLGQRPDCQDAHGHPDTAGPGSVASPGVSWPERSDRG